MGTFGYVTCIPFAAVYFFFNSANISSDFKSSIPSGRNGEAGNGSFSV